MIILRTYQIDYLQVRVKNKKSTITFKYPGPPTQSAPEQIDNGAADVQPFDFQAYNQPRLARTEGMLKLEIPNFSNLRSKVSTPFQYIGNLPW